MSGEEQAASDYFRRPLDLVVSRGGNRKEQPMKVGDTLKDNDPRMGHRVLTITSIGVIGIHGAESVRAKGRAGPEVSISTKRIYMDGKPRRSGFDLVPANAQLTGRATAGREGPR